MGTVKARLGALALVGVIGCGDDGGDDSGGEGSSSSTTTASTSASSGTTSTSTSGTSSTTAPTSSTTTDSTTGGSSGSGTSGGTAGSTGGVAPNTDFEEIDGIVVFEAEHYTEQTNTDERQLAWYEISVQSGDLSDGEIDGCVPDTPCTAQNTPLCNFYPECDADGLQGQGQDFSDPADASNEAYLEVLPDRRRADQGFEEPSGGFTNNGGQVAVLTYRVFFNQTGRYYGYCRARGRGPAANGLHLGIDGEWPSNTLGDNSVMRWQFPSSGNWDFVNHRRGADQHTGGVNLMGVSFEDANIWIEVDQPGWHDVQVSMREDGVEIDKFMFVLDANDAPGIDDIGPGETIYTE